MTFDEVLQFVPDGLYDFLIQLFLLSPAGFLLAAIAFLVGFAVKEIFQLVRFFSR